jgi:hypothetical protein
MSTSNELLKLTVRECLPQMRCIDKNTRMRLEADYNIVISTEFASVAVAKLLIQECAKIVTNRKTEKNPGTMVISDIIELGAEYMETEEAEKIGNYNPTLKFTDEVHAKIIAGTKLARESTIKAGSNISESVALKYSEKDMETAGSKGIIIFNNDFKKDLERPSLFYTIATIFLEELVNYMIDNSTPGENNTIEIDNLIIFGIYYAEDIKGAFALPGQLLKLQIKNDSSTEDE